MRLGVHIATWSLGAFSALAAAAADPSPGDLVRGLDAQETKLEWKLPHKKIGVPAETATRKCQVFSGYAVLASDEGEMGVADLEIRVRPEGMKAKEVCGAAFRGRSIRPTGRAAGNYPVGVVGRFLFSVYPDADGILQGFTLLDLERGELSYEDAYEYERELRFERAGDGPVMTYWAPLDGFDCVPRHGQATCWTRIREKLGLPVTVPQPDCERAIAKEPSMLQGEPDRSAQIAVHVRVRRLSRRDATYLPDPPICAAAP